MLSNLAQSQPAVKAGPSKVRAPLTYSALPHDLIEDRRLIGTDVRLAGVLLKYCKAKDHCWPAIDTLTRDLGVCRRTVQYSLKRLVAAGWVATRSAGNPTGRVLVMTWREAVAPPGVQAPYSQGLPRTGAVPGRSVAPEGMGREEKAPAPPPRRERDRPLSPGEVLGHYTEAGWLDRPPGDPLRRLAERNVERALGAGEGVVQSANINARASGRVQSIGSLPTSSRVC